MPTLLHLSFRVRDPARSAALYAELLDGQRIENGPILRSLGVQSIEFGTTHRHPLADSLEFWPSDRHWNGEAVALDPAHHQPFGHLAVASEKTHAELVAIATRHGATMKKESRGPGALVSVLYDFDGNFMEFFPPVV